MIVYTLHFATGREMGQMGSTPILHVNFTITTDTMLHFDRNSDVTSKQTSKLSLLTGIRCS